MSLSEAAVQAAIRIRAGELGILLFRNNVGACSDASGRVIRYGLANDSAKQNKRIKSGDCIGILSKQYIVSASGGAMGSPSVLSVNVGVFLSVECKEESWQGGPHRPLDPNRFNEREQAQQRWIDIVRSSGGIAFFARSVGEFEVGIQGYV